MRVRKIGKYWFCSINVNNEWVIGKGVTLPEAHAELKKAGVDLWK
ncbi:MAG: hypothetical protein SOR11_04845 [Fusobacterium sp.]|nr:hypothetical protein [Fusobacterium sp.]MDY3059311.1 hypothetical protein [Fusobacterium sp.]